MKCKFLKSISIFTFGVKKHAFDDIKKEKTKFMLSCSSINIIIFLYELNYICTKSIIQNQNSINKNEFRRFFEVYFFKKK